MPQSQPFAAGGFAHPDAAGTAIKTIAFGKLPAAAAGKAFAKPAAITVTATGAGGKITGAYAKPIVLANSDKTGATLLQINGKTASPKVTLKASTDKVTLKYTGLAIKPATFGAVSPGAKAGKATFSPVLANIVYTGPKVSAAAEVDLTSTTPSTAGYSGAFTATHDRLVGYVQRKRVHVRDDGGDRFHEYTARR